MGKVKAIFAIPELRQKIFITLLFLAIYRVGFAIPIPYVDQLKMNRTGGAAGGALGQVLGFVSMFSGGDLGRASVFGLGIMPYISASIIFQLLGAVYPPLEKLMKEGESGRKKINEYTRYATVAICLFQSFMYIQYVMRPSPNGLGWYIPGPDGTPLYDNWFYWMVMVVTMTAGTIFLMWIGEQIDEYGIGNGISLIIMAGIVSRIPDATMSMFFEPGSAGWHVKQSVFSLGGSGSGGMSLEKLVTLVVMFLAVVVAVIAITKGQRRIPTQSARHVRGRRVFGGNRQNLPLRVNQAGVMPVIFASSLLVLPTWIFQMLAASTGWAWAIWVQESFYRGSSWLYNMCFIALIYMFCYFWTAISFNPKDLANNLKDYGSFIPGYRPGKRTEEYLDKVLARITYVGAAFLAVIAVIPTLITATLDVDPRLASFYGGTSLLIVISVALDLVQKINSHLVMRNYPGLTED